MENINTKALKTLEYDKIIELLAQKAQMATGREKCRSLLPSTEISEIELMQQETGEATEMIIKRGGPSMGGMKDIRPYIRRASMGGILSPAELLYTGDFLNVCKKVSAYGRDMGKNDNYPLLAPMFMAIILLPGLMREIETCILNEQEIADDASPGLSSVRKNIRTAGARIKEQLNSIIHSQTYKNYLQDSVITIRGGRYCVPVKQEYKNLFPGIIHDQSGTGATIFMEPSSVLSLNNKIKELMGEEEKEIEKILARLSNMVYENQEAILANFSILTDLDFAFAKGQLSVSINGCGPEFNEKGYINLKKARHPLLNRDTVVPTDIYLGKDFKILLITGPNTGGKTVSLKTIGLFTLMGQAGLHISAFWGSELSVFKEVFADIGDEQSIEQSLSTFSSHMTNIVAIVDNLGHYPEKSLVLLDELGAGTDPTEGAALAISIISHLKDRGATAAITTHYSELKIYALETEGIENASCEFDVDSLRPTYKLLTGIPGKSNAFAISRRLGLREDIIDLARQTLSKEDKRFEDVLTDLEISRKSVEMEKEKAEQYRREAQKLKGELESQKEKLSAQRERIISEAKAEAKRIMQETKREADGMIKELSKQIALGGLAQSESVRKAIKEKVDSLSTKEKQDRPRKTVKHLKKGDGVFIHSLNQRGIALGPADESGSVTVQAGIMKIKVNISDLSPDEREEKYTVSGHSGNAKIGKALHFSPELDLRGMMSAEAYEKTDKYLDDAYLAGVKQVTIIHGKGTGVLRSTVHNLLKSHHHVKSYRLGSYGEGEHGVTICEIK